MQQRPQPVCCSHVCDVVSKGHLDSFLLPAFLFPRCFPLPLSVPILLALPVPILLPLLLFLVVAASPVQDFLFRFWSHNPLRGRGGGVVKAMPGTWKCCRIQCCKSSRSAIAKPCQSCSSWGTGGMTIAVCNNCPMKSAVMSSTSFAPYTPLCQHYILGDSC